MLQRIQSLLLLVVLVSMVSMLFFPVWSKIDTATNEKVELSALALTHSEIEPSSNAVKQIIGQDNTFYIAILAVLVACIAAYSTFQYQNRLLQMKLGALNSLLMAAVMGLFIYFVMDAEKLITPMKQGSYETGFYLGVAAMIANVLSNRFIKRDENLVRSADRIR